MPFSPLASLTVHQLQVFLVAARSQSLREASVALGVSVPALSEQVRTLERVLGVQLFIRSRGHRGIRLTNNGQILAEGSTTAIQSLEDTLARMDRAVEPERQVVEFGAGAIFSEEVVPRLYMGFQTAYPHIDVRTVALVKSQVLDRLRRGRIDLGCVIAPVDDPRLEVEPSGLGFGLVLVARRDHPLAGKARAPVSALAGQKFVLAPMPSLLRSLVQRRLNDSGVELEVGWEISSSRASLQAVKSGLGITAVGTNLAHREAAAGDLSILAVDGFPIACEYVLVWRPDRLSAAAGAFRAHLLEHVREVQL